MRAIVFLLSFFLMSCGYRWASLSEPMGRLTLSVPFVEGDRDGSLTHAVVYALSSSGRAEIRQNKAPYQLRASIAGSHVETVGYRRDKQKISGETKKNLVAAEERRVLTVELALYEISSDRVVYGPIRLDAEADYDYLDGDSMQDLAFKNPLGIQQTVLPFSLGQLEPKEAAHEAVARPLYEKIAKKIADAVLDGWEGVR